MSSAGLKRALALLVLAALAASGLTRLARVKSTPVQSAPMPHPSQEFPTVEALPDTTYSPPEVNVTIPEQLADAFQAATGHRARYSLIEDGDTYVIRPLRIIELPFGQALLTERNSDDACHACPGAIDVYYLRKKAEKIEVTGRWPRAIEGWGWGHPPTDWNLTNRFTSYPAIYATGGYLAMGVVTGGATITELRPSGPVTSDLIDTSYDDEGTVEDGDRSCVVEGRITNIRKDRSFDVLVTGSVRATDRYVKRDGRFVVVKRIRWDIPCGYPES